MAAEVLDGEVAGPEAEVAVCRDAGRASALIGVE
jgi:hypothetical protein